MRSETMVRSSARGYAVVRLGNTASGRAAPVAGEIDLYPEYTGNAAFFFDRAGDPVRKDAEPAIDRPGHSIGPPRGSCG